MYVSEINYNAKKIMNVTYLLPVLGILILFCCNSVTAREIQAPPSLQGASLEIFGRKVEYKNLHYEVNLNLRDGISSESREDKIVTYEPKGKTAHITAVHLDKRKEDYSSGEYYEKDPSLFKRYYLSGEKSYEQAKGENPKPATIVFTDKGGYCYYQGILQGYLTCDKKPEAENLTGLPVTIFLDEEKTPDPELVKLIKQLDSGELTGRQANWIRYELAEYWGERLNKVYSALMEHYSNLPEIAEKLKTERSHWESSQSALREAYASCLTQGDEKEQRGQWFEFNMLRLDYDATEHHCRVLEELLDTLKQNDL